MFCVHSEELAQFCTDTAESVISVTVWFGSASLHTKRRVHCAVWCAETTFVLKLVSIIDIYAEPPRSGKPCRK